MLASAHHERQLLAYAWAASQILEAHGHDPVQRGEVYFTDTSLFHTLPNVGPAQFHKFETLLDQVAQTVKQSWEEVEASATQPDGPKRPCTRCAFFKRGCRGKT